MNVERIREKITNGFKPFSIAMSDGRNFTVPHPEFIAIGKNVVVGNYIYSLLLGMSVPDVSGKAIANLEVESLRHVAPTFHGDTIYGETTVLDKTPSKSKTDRGIVYVETTGYNQDGVIVCIFRRKVMVPTQEYIEARGGEQPGRPEPIAR